MQRLGLPWRSSGWDSEPPMQGAWVRSLVGELRSHMLHMAKKKKESQCPEVHPESQRCHFLDKLPKQNPESFSTYKVGERYQTPFILELS